MSLTTPFDLSTLQNWMQQLLITSNSDHTTDINHVITDSSRLTARERIAVYQRSYYARLLHCMREQFPALCYALGEALFNDFAKEYLQHCPSNSYTLYDLGKRFPDYLNNTRPDKNTAIHEREFWIDFMVELARFEHSVFTLFDAHGYTKGSLATYDTPDEDLELQPCFVIGAYQFEVADYYHSVRKKSAPKLPAKEESLIATVRKDYLTHTIALSQAQYIFLQKLLHGDTIKQALSIVSESLTLAYKDVKDSWSDKQGVREKWIDMGFFIDRRHSINL